MYHLFSRLLRVGISKTNETSFIEDVRRELCDIDISVSSSKHIDDLWLHWKGKFNTICDIHAPLKSFRVKGNLHPWVDHSILAKN